MTQTTARTATPIRTSVDSSTAAKVAEALQPTLVELIELSLTSKQLHWTVVGPRFKAVHEHLDELTDAYRRFGDQVAERLTALGVVPDGRALRIAGDTSSDPVPAEWIDDRRAVELMADRVQAVASGVRGRATALEGVDLASQDLLIELTQVLDEQLWMLSAQLA